MRLRVRVSRLQRVSHPDATPIRFGSGSTPERVMTNLLAYADGESDLLTIAERIGADVMECAVIAENPSRYSLMEASDVTPRPQF